MSLADAYNRPAPKGMDPKEPMARGNFHGKGGELLLLWLKNGLLTALTLGWYYPWGKAALIRYFHSRTAFDGERFRFTGTGGEFLLGFLQALAAVTALGIPSILLCLGAQAIHPSLGPVPFVGCFVILVFLSQYALFSTLRYRASRIVYRETGFRLEGNPWEFARKGIRYLLLTLITFGIFGPYYKHWVYGRIFNNLKFGNLAFAWDAKADEYWKLAMKGFLFSVLTLGVYYFFWLPRWWAYVRGHLSVGGCRFHGGIKPSDLFRHALTNLLLFVLTLGLGTPWVMTRTTRFFLTRLAREHPAALKAALQVGRERVPARGAFLDGVDAGVGLGVGF
jgi:uncharacterized membrane protein YjgN (DUF898 family)